MLDERKTAILKAVVQEYITTAQPVGSTHVANAPGVQVSSATVRNEMAVLEQEGYLAQPHTSAGRVPTDKGYRFYVDHMATPGRLEPVAQQRVGQFFDTAHGRLEELLHQTTNLLAQVTHHAAVVVGPSAESAVVRSVQVIGLNGRHATVVAVLSNGAVENEVIELPVETSDVRLAAATAHLQAHMHGSSLEGPATVPPTGDRELDAVCDIARSALGRSTDESVFVGGAASMAHAFDTVDTVRSVLRTLEQQYVMVSLVRDILNRGLSVAIGTEHGIEPLAACSVVVKPVVVDGEQVGTVGVLGPTRMDYPQALATVEAVSDRLGRRLSDGGTLNG
ncbi:MAG: heat-inducible transcription repressor HrcA [Actinobacteria bacterium]|nr:heat-inducible transcription repressor HrcA [Actinomycetota bacterium]